MAEYILYGTGACHLCELAEGMLLEQRRQGRQFRFRKVDIAEDDALYRRYGLRIPVLRHPDGRELGWPFSPEDLSAMLSG